MFGSQLAGKVTGNSTAYQGGVIAFQLIDNNGQCLVIFVFGKDKFQARLPLTIPRPLWLESPDGRPPEGWVAWEKRMRANYDRGEGTAGH